MNETEIESKTREYLLKNGWKLTNLPKTIGQHGCDITAWHPIKRRVLLIEAKGGDNKNTKHQTIHNSFYTLLGQVLSRMDKEGNSNKKGRIYAITIPSNWETVYKKKIKKMPYGWSLLKLKVFLVSKDKVEVKNYKSFLK